MAGFQLEDVVTEEGKHQIGWVNHDFDVEYEKVHKYIEGHPPTRSLRSDDTTSDITDYSMDGVLMYGDAAVGESIPKGLSSKRAVIQATDRNNNGTNVPKKSPLVTFEEMQNQQSQSRNRISSISVSNIFDTFRFGGETDDKSNRSNQSDSWNWFGTSSNNNGSFFGYLFGSTQTPSPSFANPTTGITIDPGEESKTEMLDGRGSSADRPPPPTPPPFTPPKPKDPKVKEWFSIGQRIGTSLDDTSVSTSPSPPSLSDEDKKNDKKNIDL
mmetsp:Transcript_1126/g.1434  ORF Transcript_1126/g.1434 Transcript_1126/m.1434 type:complete len:270 (+) Transcript_1126:127-936(+)